jgi:hypothetical protein
MTNKVPKVPPLSREKIESFATRVLLEVQPDVFTGHLPVEIDAVYELYIPREYEIVTGYTDLSSLGPEILGYTYASERKSFVDKSLIDTDDTVSLKRGRATIGHECGHCVYHVNVLNYFQSILASEGMTLRRADRSTLRPYEDPEWQAWEFARSCLMPRTLIARYYNSDHSVQEMAEIFDVNASFMEVRLKTLGYRLK